MIEDADSDYSATESLLNNNNAATEYNHGENENAIEIDNEDSDIKEVNTSGKRRRLRSEKYVKRWKGNKNHRMREFGQGYYEVIADIDDFGKLSEIIDMMITLSAAITKMMTFQYYSNKFLGIMEFLRDPIFATYSNEFDHYMAKTVKTSILIAKFYKTTVAICIILVGIFPILDNKPFPFPFPFDLGIYSHYMYVFQVFSLALSAWNNSSIDTLITSLMGLSAAQLDILCEKIKISTSKPINKITEFEIDIFVVTLLKQCVEHHNAIIKLVQDIEQVFTVALFVQFVASVMVICNTVFHIVLISTINMQFIMLLEYCIVMMLQLFMYCWYGNEIILKSTKISDACYNCNWYERGPLVRTYLFMIMERCKRPLNITTLKLSNVSLTAFKSMSITNNANAFRIQYSMLSASGIWPEKNATLIYKLRCALSWILTAGLFVSMLMEVIADIKDFTKLSEILYMMITLGATLAKMTTLAYYSNTFLKLIEFLKDPVFVTYSNDFDHYMAETVKQSTFIAKSYRVLVGLCVFLVAAFPLLDNKPFPFPFPFELGIYSYYMYVFQVISLGLAAWNNSSIDTLITSLMGLAAAQLDILREKIVNIKMTSSNSVNTFTEVEVNDFVVKILKQCVEHHNAIIRLIQDIEQVFTVALFAQFGASVMVICNTVFHIVLISAVNFQFMMLLEYFMVMMFQLFMYCWYGNEIILKSTQVGEACYHCNWYQMGYSVRAYIFIIMERSKRPLIITTLKLSNASLIAFKSILQWSYSCLALLLKMYQKKNKASLA
ncbi:hypothetical protein RN001_001468 [Aquatica leii]|uniref:Odorant receptor n=1 Tax=Aquatica leii TaxID=1421715 RepID=A0AAN7SJK7_9COLE|nr:hypothetical protein RN001_001468 [Aquatica leii]